MARLGNLIIEDKELENERFEVTDKNEHYFLGPNLTLRNCTVIIKVPARLLFINQARFIDCTFEVKQELKNHQQWICAYLKGCRFKGRFSGCDFGHWPEYGNEPGYQQARIEDCDFTEARLDECRFHGCNPSTLRFPKWPHFTFLDPIGKTRELNSIQWPGLFGPVVVENVATHPPSTRALTFFAPSEAKRYGTTEAEFRAVIEKLDCIVY